MREGDYLRQHVAEADDDDEQTSTTGCFRFPKSRSLSHIVKSSRLSESHDCPSMTSSSTSSMIGRLAAAGFWFTGSGCNTHSDSAVSAKRKPLSPTGSCGGSGGGHNKQGQGQGRRFIRVVRDENAPPPDAFSDNPNTVCRYSQNYLRDYYAKKRETGNASSSTMGCCEKPSLPYTTSGHTILKKSLTDPSSERPIGGRSSEPTVAMATKHATFNDVVTVFDIVQHTVTTEHLHDDDDNDGQLAEEGLSEEETPSDSDGTTRSGGEFFLASGAELTVTGEPSPPYDLDQHAVVMEPMATGDEDATDACDENRSVAMATGKSPPVKCQANALQNIFAPFNEPPPALGPGFEASQRPTTTRPQLRRVKLENLMEQARVSEDASTATTATGETK